MKSAVIVFPGSNCDRDAVIAIEAVTGQTPERVWHKETALPEGLDLAVVPGGFSYGDYLRCGAMAGRSPVIEALKTHVSRGGYGIGICNGFQVLTETGILPGALVRNTGLDFVCRPQALSIGNAETPFTQRYAAGDQPIFPIAHHDGNYVADEATLDGLEGDGQIAFRYVDNPNGSARDIAGVVSSNGRVLGLMPHPERALLGQEGGEDGRALFEGVLAA